MGRKKGLTPDGTSQQARLARPRQSCLDILHGAMSVVLIDGPTNAIVPRV